MKMETKCMTYTVSEVAKILGIGRNLAYEMVQNDKLPSIKLGSKRIVVPKAAIDEMLRRPVHKLTKHKFYIEEE
jgi:DNA binding domain, excisionase family